MSPCQVIEKCREFSSFKKEFEKFTLVLNRKNSAIHKIFWTLRKVLIVSSTNCARNGWAYYVGQIAIFLWTLNCWPLIFVTVNFRAGWMCLKIFEQELYLTECNRLQLWKNGCCLRMVNIFHIKYASIVQSSSMGKIQCAAIFLLKILYTCIKKDKCL